MDHAYKGFDSEGFYSALAATVEAKSVSWKQVSTDTGVSASTLTRMAQGRHPDAASLAALSAWAGLNPADFVSIPVMPLQSLKDDSSSLAGHVDYLANRQPRVFSALTVFHGTRRLIVHNDAHSPARQRSDLAHELAHALLIHPPHPPFCSSGQRT